MNGKQVKAVVDIMGVCMFTSIRSDPQCSLSIVDHVVFFSKATGIEISGDELLTVGRRIINIEKAFNIIHAGFRVIRQAWYES